MLPKPYCAWRSSGKLRTSADFWVTQKFQFRRSGGNPGICICTNYHRLTVQPAVTDHTEEESSKDKGHMESFSRSSQIARTFFRGKLKVSEQKLRWTSCQLCQGPKAQKRRVSFQTGLPPHSSPEVPSWTKFIFTGLEGETGTERRHKLFEKLAQVQPNSCTHVGL